MAMGCNPLRHSEYTSIQLDSVLLVSFQEGAGCQVPVYNLNEVRIC